jgi:hypothetical protein
VGKTFIKSLLVAAATGGLASIVAYSIDPIHMGWDTLLKLGIVGAASGVLTFLHPSPVNK